MNEEKSKLYRRCKCHKWLTTAEFDDKGNVTERYCNASREPLKEEDTYWATFTDQAEVTKKEPELVQGSLLSDEDIYESGEWMG